MIKFNNTVITKSSLLNEIEDEFNGNVDVAVEFDDNYAYVVAVSTPADLLKEMEIEESNFILPYSPSIIVKKLTHKIITEAIHAYGYWLKLCQFGDDLDISVFNKLEAQHREELKLSELEGLDQLFYYVQKYLNFLLITEFFLNQSFFSFL